MSNEMVKRQHKLEKQARKRAQKVIKNQRKKGKEMFGFGKDKKTVHRYGYQKEVVPTTGEDSTTMSTVLFKQSSLDKIGEMCLPAAGDSEFQVHYRCLQIIIGSETGQRLVATIPTVFFNMPQKVSTASVDFSLDDVNEISEKVASVSESLSEKYFAAFPTKLFQNLGFTIEARENEIGSMHRHPGAFGFSGTDLDNKVKHPGVIFRTLGATDRIQVDSVMYIPGKRVNIFTTETRVIDVKPTEDGEGIEGTYLRTPTFSYIINDSSKPIDFREFFGRAIKEDKISFTTNRDKSDKDYEEMIDIFELFLNNLQEDYEPILIIDPDMIEESHAYYQGYQANTSYGGYGQRAKPAAHAHATRTIPVSTAPKAANDYDFYGDEYGDYYDEIYTAPEETSALVVRPTWKKVQALGMLTTKGIDVNNNASIDGSGSVKDVLAITTAMTQKGLTDEEINNFFNDAAYTEEMLLAAASIGQ